MVKRYRAIILVIILLCSWLLSGLLAGRGISQSTLTPAVTFSGENNVMYFFDRSKAKVYRYNVQGRLTRTYVIEELGKDLQLK